MNTYRHIITGISTIISLWLLSSCAKVNVFTEPPGYPVIDSIAPASGKIGTQIRLYGTGFSYHPVQNTVMVNGVQVRVDSPSSSTVVLATIISVTGTGHVAITVDSLKAEGPIFTYDENAVSINGLFPSSGWVDTTVSIRGVGFGNNQAAVTVRFNDHIATIKSLSDTLLVVTAPDALNQSEGMATVTVAVGSKLSNGVPFTYARQHQPVITDITAPGRHDYTIVPGDTATITGKYFGSLQTGAVVEIWYANAALTPDPSVLSWNDTSVRIIIPSYNEPDGTTLTLYVKQGNNAASSVVLYQLKQSSSSGKIYALGITTDNKVAVWKDGVRTDISGCVSPNSIAVANGDIYVAGYSASGAGGYYKNGVFMPLDGVSNGIFIDGANVYVAGKAPNSTAGHNQACYWKNGTRVNLTDGSTEAFAADITVAGTDVYVAGSYTSPVNGAHNQIITYWKNGSQMDCTDGSKETVLYYGTCLAVSGTNVYVAGSYYISQLPIPNGTRTEACYWTNGVRTELSDIAGSAYASGIYVSGNDVYVSGTRAIFSTPPAPNIGQAVYWKNGTPVPLTDTATGTSSAGSIFVSGTDVYPSGARGSAAGGSSGGGYWKNGAFTALPGCRAIYKMVVLP